MSFRFTPLTRADLPQLGRWLAEPHVARWWGEPEDYGPSIDGADPTHAYIAHLDGDAIGLIQTYRWADYPKEAAAVGAREDEAGIDYLIAEAALLGRGIGSEMIRAFMAEVLDPGTPVRAQVAAANPRSWRCLEKVGFRREPGTREIEGEKGPQYILVYAPTAR